MFFGRKQESAMDENTASMIRRGEALLAQTQEHLKTGGAGNNLTCRLQLKNDCDALTRAMAPLKKGKITAKNLQTMEHAFISLKTTSENIMGWRFIEEEADEFHGTGE